ncbi:MAG: hypothetical protein IPM76_22345 [Chloroflexi bacterium]|nr:hypothetical protein [Chloroflexota bacterium]
MALTTRQIIQRLGALAVIETHCRDGSCLRRLTPIEPEIACILQLVAQVLDDLIASPPYHKMPRHTVLIARRRRRRWQGSLDETPTPIKAVLRLLATPDDRDSFWLAVKQSGYAPAKTVADYLGAVDWITVLLSLPFRLEGAEI